MTQVMFLDTLASNTASLPAKTAIEFLDAPLQKLSYAQLEGQVRRCMVYLESLGVGPGDRVALQLPKCQEFIVLNLATLRMGAISLTLNPAYPTAELRYFLGDSGARIWFGTRDQSVNHAEELAGLPALKHCVQLVPGDADHFPRILNQVGFSKSRSPVSIDPQDTALMVYTSGTTGRPKGAMITHDNLSANLQALHTAWGWEEADRLLHVLPIFHVHGLVVALYGALYAGATTLLTRSFDAHRTLELLVEHCCTLFMAVPTIYQRILALPDASEFDLGHMRLLTSGSDRLPDHIFLNFQSTFGHTLLERYGMTETGMNLSNPLHGERRVGSVGLPLPGVEARIVDPKTGSQVADGQVGEVQIRGPNVFKGYWRQPEKTTAAFTQDGWLRTGDLGLREPDGYFTLQGRSKDLIITGGLNVYPPEVEHVLAEHPGVETSAVIGCPDPEWGERIVAVVVPKAGQNLSAEELIEFCRQRLAPYKCPRVVYLDKALPRNAMGKVQKGALRQSYCRP